MLALQHGALSAPHDIRPQSTQCNDLQETKNSSAEFRSHYNEKLLRRCFRSLLWRNDLHFGGTFIPVAHFPAIFAWLKWPSILLILLVFNETH